jgi:3-hydroxyisobutyrate dehydrogenase-like beta-hydroxyacid dehydrogenase
MNVLFVGLGHWGEKHLRVLTQLGATVWVADRSGARRQWAVEQGVDQARAVADFRAALPHVAAVDGYSKEFAVAQGAQDRGQVLNLQARRAWGTSRCGRSTEPRSSTLSASRTARAPTTDFGSW